LFLCTSVQVFYTFSIDKWYALLLFYFYYVADCILFVVGITVASLFSFY